MLYFVHMVFFFGIIISIKLIANPIYSIANSIEMQGASKVGFEKHNMCWVKLISYAFKECYPYFNNCYHTNAKTTQHTIGENINHPCISTLCAS